MIDLLGRYGLTSDSHSSWHDFLMAWGLFLCVMIVFGVAKEISDWKEKKEK